MRCVHYTAVGLILLLSSTVLAGSSERQGPAGGPSQGDARYVLERGDAVELSILGLAEAKFRAVVGPDGNVNLPLAGQVKAAGVLVGDLHAKVQNLVAAKPFRARTQDGREQLVMVTPDQVMLSMAEYRPVYLNGDVSKPGQQEFRPGMTVRQAVALAGGYDIARFRMNNPVLETADLRAEYDALWIRFATQQEYVVQLRSRLDGNKADQTDRVETPVRTDTAQRVQKLASRDVSLRDAAYQEQRASYLEAIDNELRRITVLQQHAKRERDGAASDSIDFKRIQDAERRGIVSGARLADLRRTVLGSETRTLQADAKLIEAERSRDELKLKLQQLDSNHRIRLGGELQAVTLALETTRTKLQAVSEKLAYSGLIRSQLISGEFSRPRISIIRGAGSQRQATLSEEDDELRPGDVVEVSLQSFGEGLSADARVSLDNPGWQKRSAGREGALP
jgi:polysaccharide biosynthesis/export protein